MAAVVRYVEYYYNRTVNRCQPIWKNFVEKLCGFRSFTEKTGAFRRTRRILPEKRSDFDPGGVP
ncbi:MAG: hypothetical protein II650_08315, partial [Clostridia bacterium]|nr:hypothetical protein [Clostridia bacterium]